MVLFDFLMRGRLGLYGTFQPKFATSILEGKKSAAKRRGQRVAPFVLRRRKEEVAKDPPKKVETFERGLDKHGVSCFASMGPCLWRQDTIVSSAWVRATPRSPCAARLQ